MTLMINTDSRRRIWTALQRADTKTATCTVDSVDDEGTTVQVEQLVVVADIGSTLELDPGETADVTLPDDFTDDPWLKPAPVAKTRRTAAAAPDEPAGDVPPAV